jgi:hypothetical protein
MKIQKYINERHKYKVDITYQRPSGAWSNPDNQCLIDTILRGEPMPLFFINNKSDEGLYYIVDGQQRLTAIQKFYDNKLKLSKKFSGAENHGKTFGGDNPISDEQREIFLNYDLKLHFLDDYDDEKVRVIFSRLQRGKPLTLGERLNANPGSIVLLMREIAKHPFIYKSVGVPNERYGTYPDAARILFYEKYGCKDSGTPAIVSFFDENKTLAKDSKEFNNAIRVLNFLQKVFPPEPGSYQYLSKHAWVFAVYTMVRELMIGYSLEGQEENLRNFILDFHGKVYNEDIRKSDFKIQKFYDNVRGGWAEKIIAIRKNILIDKFLSKYNVNEKDEKRQINEEDKIAVLSKYPACPMCHKKFKDHKEPEYHHKQMHYLGGKTDIDNIIPVHQECHKKIHGKEEVIVLEGDFNGDL